MPEITYGSAFDTKNYKPKIDWSSLKADAIRSQAASDAVTDGRISTSPECLTVNSRPRNVVELNANILKGKRTAEQERKRKAAAKAARAKGKGMQSERI